MTFVDAGHYRAKLEFKFLLKLYFANVGTTLGAVPGIVRITHPTSAEPGNVSLMFVAAPAMPRGSASAITPRSRSVTIMNWSLAETCNRSTAYGRP